MDTKLKKILEKNKIKYKLHNHRKVFTAHDEAATQKRKVSEIAKVVLIKFSPSSSTSEKIIGTLKAKKSYFALVVLPAQKYCDLRTLKKALAAKKVSMASEKDITKQLKTKVGLLHPFGVIYSLPVMLDRGCSRASKLIASAGTYTESVEISVKDFSRLNQPILGVFCKSRR